MGEKHGTQPTGGDRYEGSITGEVERANPRILITGRTGAIVMRSVSIFLTCSRKVTSSTKRQQSSCSGIKMLGNQRRKSRKMPLDINLKNVKIAEALKKKTKFSKQELETLCKIYIKLTTSTGARINSSVSNGPASPIHCIEGIDRTVFRELLHNTFDFFINDTLIERMFSCWDRDSEGAIRLEPWIIGMDIFLRGNLREKAEFCFKVYDLNSDGFITKDEIFQLFKNCLMKQPCEEDHEEGVRDLSEMALKKLDIDHDGKISFDDYKTTIQEEPLLLEAFGQVLPTPKTITAFLLTLKPT